MPELRTPYSIAYCRKVKCDKRSGNKCKLVACQRAGTEKRTAYFVTTGHLAEGDIPDA